uniref:PID domain-containing protein n=1 Tax=Ciona savignyi TaxID=51511 RepID=H2ZD39_CIOSA
PSSSGEGSERSTSSIESSEDLSQSSLSTPEFEFKQSGTGSFSSFRSSIPDSPLLSSTTSEYAVKILGSLETIQGHEEGPLEVINAIDIAQCEENLPLLATGDDVYISISINGLQVTDNNQRDVLKRIPLHTIERIVTYDDGIYGNTILAVKVVNEHQIGYSLLAYQCSNPILGQKITRCYSHVLASVMSSSPMVTDESGEDDESA